MARVTTEQLSTELGRAEDGVRAAEQHLAEVRAAWGNHVAGRAHGITSKEEMDAAEAAYREAMRAAQGARESVDEIRARLHEERRHELLASTWTDAILQRDAVRDAVRRRDARRDDGPMGRFRRLFRRP